MDDDGGNSRDFDDRPDGSDMPHIERARQRHGSVDSSSGPVF